MVKYARSGGVANAIAIRIARAASGRDDIAIVGTTVGMIGIYLLIWRQTKFRYSSIAQFRSTRCSQILSWIRSSLSI